MDVFLRTTSKDIIERSLASLWASCWWEGLRTEKSQGIESGDLSLVLWEGMNQ